MKKTYEDFLQLLKASINKSEVKINNYNWQSILQLSNIHKVLPLVYEALYKSEEFKNTDKDFQKYLKNTSMQIIYNQIQRSERFLQIYEEFNKKGLKILVFKGIILRQLYPIPDERISGDEDLLIKKEDLKKAEEILKSKDMDRILSKEEEEDVYHYFCKKTGLHLELHTRLFGNSSEIYKKMEKTFQGVFDNSEKVIINNVTINTFSLDKHFLYVICHAMKHFVSSGIGIRQICDIVMYINKYFDKINWNYIWQEVSNFGYETLFVNFLQIGIDYLGLDEKKITYAKNKNKYYINTKNLLEDIIDGGIYGASNQSRLNAANMSLDAFNNHTNSKINSNLAAIFPKADNLKKRYKYLENHPFLLPIAWISRISTYIKDRGSISNVGLTAKETIAVGNKRIDLLKEYKLIR